MFLKRFMVSPFVLIGRTTYNFIGCGVNSNYWVNSKSSTLLGKFCMSDLALSFAVCLSGISLGMVLTSIAEMYELKKAYKAKIHELDEIGKAANKATESHIDKMLHLEDRLNTIDFRIRGK